MTLAQRIRSCLACGPGGAGGAGGVDTIVDYDDVVMDWCRSDPPEGSGRYQNPPNGPIAATGRIPRKKMSRTWQTSSRRRPDDDSVRGLPPPSIAATFGPIIRPTFRWRAAFGMTPGALPDVYRPWILQRLLSRRWRRFNDMTIAMAFVLFLQAFALASVRLRMRPAAPVITVGLVVVIVVVIVIVAIIIPTRTYATMRILNRLGVDRDGSALASRAGSSVAGTRCPGRREHPSPRQRLSPQPVRVRGRRGVRARVPGRPPSPPTTPVLPSSSFSKVRRTLHLSLPSPRKRRFDDERSSSTSQASTSASKARSPAGPERQPSRRPRRT